MTINPAVVFGTINAAAKEKMEMAIQFGDYVLQTLLWVLITYTFVRYVQECLYIERLYVYIGRIESKICRHLGDDLFSREGTGYLKDYPLVLNMIDVFYKIMAPVLFFLINLVHICREYMDGQQGILAKICDLAMFIAVSLITVLYFLEVNRSLWKKINKKINPNCKRVIIEFIVTPG